MEFIDLELVETHQLTETLGRFCFKTSQPFAYQSGQYATLKIERPGLIGPGIKEKDGIGSVLRAYSIASAPHEDLLELYIAWVKSGGRREDGKGVLTTELFNRTSDMKFSVASKAKGHFIPAEDERTVVMVATGTGLAPFISLCRHFQEKGIRRRVVLIHGASYLSDLTYTDELQSYIDAGFLEIYYAVSRETHPSTRAQYCGDYFIERGDRSGRISESETAQAIQENRYHQTKMRDILGEALSPEHHILMLCGNPAMIRNIQLVGEAYGFENKRDIVVEQYW